MVNIDNEQNDMSHANTVQYISNTGGHEVCNRIHAHTDEEEQWVIYFTGTGTN